MAGKTAAQSAVTLASIGKIDYSAPVLEIQTRLARVRHLHIISGMVVGLPWWFLWVPILMVLSGMGGIDLMSRAPGMLWSGLVVGVVGLLGTLWFHRWSRSPARPRLANAMDEAVTGGSLLRARRQLDEPLQFESE